MKKNLVLGVCCDLTYYELQAYFVSYHRYCTDTDYVLFYQECSAYALDALTKMGVKTIKLQKGNLREMFGPASRWVPFHDFLKKHKDEYAHVLFSDVRDVIFQKDLFKTEFLAGKAASGEDYFLVSTEEEVFANDHVNNGMWLRRNYGDEIFEKLKDKLIINAGIFCATTNAMLWMMERVIAEAKNVGAKFIDQTSLNYIIYLTEVPFEVTIDTADHGEMVSVGLTDSKDTYVEDGFLLNCNHEKPALVHQYNRPQFTEFQKELDKRYRSYSIEKQYEDFVSNFDILDLLIRLDKYPEAMAQLGYMLEKNGELKGDDVRYDKIIELCEYLQRTPKNGYALDAIEHAAMHMLIVNAQSLTLEPNQIHRLSQLFRLTRTDRSVCRFAWGLASAVGKSGNPKLALEVLKSVKNKVSWDSSFYRFLADTCQAAGDKDGALEAYKKFLDVS